MFKKNLKLKLKVNIVMVLGMISTIIIAVASEAGPAFAYGQAQPTSATPNPSLPQAVLTIVVRDSIGNPLDGLVCEVLSYGWGLQINEAYAIIARGETDKNGVVAFDVSRWPNSGYRFKFSATNHLKPANTYILPDSDNQYRGYPGAVVGGRTETQKFVLSGSDSVFYNDISKEGQLPEYQRDPIAGMEKPRVSVMDGADYLATAVAATSTAEARGEPTPTMPSPPSPSPKPGEIQAALTVTPGTAMTTTTTKAISPNTSPQTATNLPTRSNTLPTTATANPSTSLVVAQAVQPPTSLTGATTSLTISAVTTNTNTNINTAPNTGQVTSEASRTNQGPESTDTGTNPSRNGSNLLVSIFLAIFGIGCFVLFWKFRFSIYPLFGIEASSRKKSSARISIRQVKPRPMSAVNQSSTTARKDPTNSSSQIAGDIEDVE